MEFIYLITVINLHPQRPGRTWGWYEGFEDAEYVVLFNRADIFELGYYEFAVIEKMPYGVLAVAEETWWYRATFENMGALNSKVTVEKIDKPDELAQVFGFGMG